MTDNVNESQVELHDEIDNEIVEETLDESSEPKGKGGDVDAQQVSEPEAIASVDKAAKATKKASLPKTKAAMINAMYQKMNGMKKDQLSASYKAMMGEDVELSDEVVSENVDTTAELEALVESEATLSEEFKEKTAVIFEAAVKSKLSEEVSRLEEQYKEELAEEVSSMKSDLVEKVDSYLNYVVESWMEDNKLAIQNGLRAEIAEGFMSKMKDLFVESYIEVPDTKVDLVDELAEQVSELEEKLNSQTGDAIKLSEELEQYKRDAIIAEAAKGLAETQVEKLKDLVESVEFDGDFATKVETIKESYFSKQIAEEVQEVTEDVDAEVEVSGIMETYLKAIQKHSK
jgi:hypothetical protein